jgi:hypothetical protein
MPVHGHKARSWRYLPVPVGKTDGSFSTDHDVERPTAR